VPIRLNIKVVLISALFFTSFHSAATDKPKPKIEAEFITTKVASGLYMLEGIGRLTSGNIALSVGKDGVVMIDDSIPPMLDALTLAIKDITNQPIDFLLNTHAHYDHAGNNQAMGEMGAKIVAHDNTRQRLVAKQRFTAKQEHASNHALPVISFSQQMSFHLNDHHIQAFYVANAHTDGDIVIHFKNLNVLHAGEVYLNAKFPFIDIKRGGSIDGLIAAQKKILSLSNSHTKIIPGHGILANKQNLAESIAMLETSKKLISQLIANNKSEDEVAALNPLARYHGKWNRRFITTQKMTRQIYRSLVGHGQ
jgi:cyclase